MNLIIIHYHLNRGGVARVIENQLAALDAVLPADARWNAAILYGGRREGWDDGLAARLRSIRLVLRAVPELEYDHLPATGDRGGPAELLMEIMTAMGELEFAPANTVIHAHNHSLGKNGALPEVLPILAEDGYALLLQPHDFAEDFRPENYALVRRLAHEGTLYPQAPHIHYAMLNSRDHGMLAQCGAPAERLHRLPNPVLETADLPPRSAARAKLADRFQIPPDAQFVLYPVRCIRRKNVGEALLMAALAPPKTVFGLSLAPLNPTETSHYERWKRLAEELRLPCRFEVGGPGGLSFHENLAAADAIVTTSVAEGFGMATLEAWLAGCPLIGRDLPDINADFRDAGLRLDGLSPRFDVPVVWIGRDAFRNRFAAAYQRAVNAYGLPAPDDLARQIDARIVEEKVDFADLVPELQEQAIRMAAGNPACAAELRDANPWLAGALAATRATAAEQVAANAAAIGAAYSLAPSGQRLLALYDQLATVARDRPVKPLKDPRGLAPRFLTPARFRPLRIRDE